jgi:hypothetical protein
MKKERQWRKESQKNQHYDEMQRASEMMELKEQIARQTQELEVNCVLSKSNFQYFVKESSKSLERRSEKRRGR